MPKPVPWKPKEPLEKLPLAVRKDVRDKYEANKEDWEKEISDLLGKPYVLNFNVNEIWAYQPEGSNYSAGNMLSGYATGFISSLKYFLDKYDDEGKKYFNDAVTKSEVTVAVNTLADKAPYIGADIKDGVFRILFKHDSLGSNQSQLSDCIVAAIDDVPKEGLSLKAVNSIENKWDPEVDEFTEKIGELIGVPDVKIDPNFEENFAALKGKDDRYWEQNFGYYIAGYFRDGLKYQLEYQGFKGDEMLQEGLQEVFDKKTFKLRIVPKLKKGYNEVVIEDGVVYLQTTVDNWGVNQSQMGTGLVDLL